LRPGLGGEPDRVMFVKPRRKVLRYVRGSLRGLLIGGELQTKENGSNDDFTASLGPFSLRPACGPGLATLPASSAHVVRYAAVLEVAIRAPFDVRGLEDHAIAAAVLVAAGDPSVAAGVAHLSSGLTEAPRVVAPALGTPSATHSTLFRHGASIYTVSADGKWLLLFVSNFLSLCVIDAVCFQALGSRPEFARCQSVQVVSHTNTPRGRGAPEAIMGQLLRQGIAHLPIDNLDTDDYVYRYCVAHFARKGASLGGSRNV
jgi:hypothetical protein